MKFGGSSVESAGAIERVAKIVKANYEARPAVVVSAIGKTTDRLLHIAEYAANGDALAAWRKLLALQADHLQIAARLGVRLEPEIQRLFGELRGDVLEIARLGRVTPELWDAVAGFGERLSSLIVAGALEQAGLPVKHMDSRKLIVTDGRHTSAAPLTIETYAKVRRAIPCANRELVPVLGGFIGATEDGTPTTLGRGGSDFTAALIGAAINAREIQIWTDVDGMLTCDPRVVEGGRCLRTITYAEAECMARLGAKVLHPETVAPARKQRVPLSIRNSRNPGHPGTRIVDSVEGVECIVKSIAAQPELGRVALVGAGIESEAARATVVLSRAGIAAAVQEASALSIVIQVPRNDVPGAVKALHAEYFGDVALPVFYAQPAMVPRIRHASLWPVQGVRRGIHLGTPAQKRRYSSPKLARRVGSS
jgi:aspartate kinase